MIKKIFLLHHTHVDFGYTDNRDKICRDLVKMVDKVSDFVDGSAGRADGEQFRWIHEVSWVVLEYLHGGGKHREKIFDQICNGDVELTALYVNPMDLFNRETLEISTDYACLLAHENNLSWSLRSHPGSFDTVKAESFAHDARVGIVSNIDLDLESIVW